MNRRGFLRAVGAAGVLLGAGDSAAEEPSERGRSALLRRAMAARRVVEFGYHGFVRRAEPHALGRVSEGRLALLAWQVSGGSRSEPPPGWRTFLVVEIADLAVSGESFAPRPDYQPSKRVLKLIEAEVADEASRPGAGAQ